jgi:hypothetical protein
LECVTTAGVDVAEVIGPIGPFPLFACLLFDILLCVFSKVDQRSLPRSQVFDAAGLVPAIAPLVILLGAECLLRNRRQIY